MKILSFLVALTLVFSTFTAATAQDDDHERRLAIALELVEVTQGEQLTLQIGQQMSPILVEEIRRNIPDMSADDTVIAEEMLGEFLGDFVGDLIKWTAKLYADRFTFQELTEVLEFHKTEIGQKMISEMPRLMNEGARNGRNEMQQKFPHFVAELRQRLGRN